MRPRRSSSMRPLLQSELCTRSIALKFANAEATSITGLAHFYSIPAMEEVGNNIPKY